MAAELEEAKRSLEDESRGRTKLQSELRNAQADADTLRDQIEEEAEGKAEVRQPVIMLTPQFFKIHWKHGDENIYISMIGRKLHTFYLIEQWLACTFHQIRQSVFFSNTSFSR